jgi:hypothetical protein
MTIIKKTAMKNNYYNLGKIILICMMISPVVLKSQAVYDDLNNLYINKKPFKDRRTHDQSNIAIVTNYPINIDFADIIDAQIYPDDPDNFNRLPESFFPGIRFFKGNRTKTLGLIYARKSYKFSGEGNSDLGSTYKNYLEKETISRLALRFADDWHFKPSRYRRFDVDHYLGYSVNAGIAPSTKIKEEEFTTGSSSKLSIRSMPVTLGGDAYFGTNFIFGNFSIGAEFLLFGFDLQKNAGREKITEEQVINSVTTSSTYYQTDYTDLANEAFSKLKNNSTQFNMFRGFRINAAVYLNKNVK